MNVTLGRPLVATLLLVGILLAGALGLSAGLAALWTAQDERDAKSEFIARSRSSGRPPGLPALSASASPLRVLAESETLAAARVDALVRAAVVEAGGSVLSSQVDVKHEDAGVPGRIAVQAVIEGKIEALQTILFHFESGAPLILVDTLELEPMATQEGDPQSPLLHVTMTLSSYWEARREPAPRMPVASNPGQATSATEPTR